MAHSVVHGRSWRLWGEQGPVTSRPSPAGSVPEAPGRQEGQWADGGRVSPVEGSDVLQAHPFMNSKNSFLRNRTFSRVKDVTRKRRGDRRAEKRPGDGGAGGVPPSGRAGAQDARLLRKSHVAHQAHGTQGHVTWDCTLTALGLLSSAQRGGCDHSPRRDAGSETP